MIEIWKRVFAIACLCAIAVIMVSGNCNGQAVGVLLVSAKISPGPADVGRFLKLVANDGRVVVGSSDSATVRCFADLYVGSSNETLTFTKRLESHLLSQHSNRWDAVWISSDAAESAKLDADRLTELVNAGKVVALDRMAAQQAFRSAEHTISPDVAPLTTDQWQDLSRVRLRFPDDNSEASIQDGRLEIELFSDTQLYFSGRRVWSAGIDAQIRMPETANEPAVEFNAGSRPIDLVATQRSLRDRLKGKRAIAKSRRVDSGTLVLAGGGNIAGDIVKRFVALAGGDRSRIVVLPTASPDPIPERQWIATTFRSAGASSVTVLRDRDRNAVESKEFLAAIGNATGIWFGGGRQWRFVDAYEGTKALDVMRGVLKRGGVIGGSSAGASIQGDYLARGNPLGNWNIMADGYERGFAFLPGTAVDQHFSQRNRLPELQTLVKKHPTVLGVGLDEGTAIIVSGSQAEIVGEGDAYFVSPDIAQGKPTNGETPPFVKVRSGDHFDLIQLSTIE